MRLLMTLALLCCLLSAPAFAADDTVPVTNTDTTAPKTPPLRTDAGLTKAEGQIAEGKFMQGIETLSGVLTRHPGNADALTYIGYAWLQLGDTDKAASFFVEALQYDPKHLGANKYVADLYLAQGDFPRALEQLQVLRLICAGSIDCAEMDMLQGEMNKYKKGEIPKLPEKKSEEKKPQADGNQ